MQLIMIILLKENERYEGLEDDEIEKWPAHEVANGGGIG